MATNTAPAPATIPADYSGDITATRSSDGMVRHGVMVGGLAFVGRFTGTEDEFRSAGWTLTPKASR